MHFPDNIISDIRSLYSGFQTRIMLIGEHQVTLRPSRGVRQGWPLSPALFALFAEPFGALTDAIGEATMYAPSSIELCSAVLAAIDSKFCTASGTKLNSMRTRLLLINVQQNSPLLPLLRADGSGLSKIARRTLWCRIPGPGGLRPHP